MKAINNKIISSVIVTFCLAAFSGLQAQEDAKFSQFYANKMFYNPAGMISDDLFRVSIVDKEQWWGSAQKGVRPSHRLLSVSQFFTQQNMGVALMVYQWQQNVVNNLAVKAAYSYHLQVNPESFISFGVNVGFFTNFIAKAITPSGTALPEGYLDQNMNMDLGLGIEFYNEEITAGVSVQHIPIRIGENPMMLSLHSYYYFGYDFQLDENWSLFPMLVLRNASRSTDVDINLRAFYRDIVYFGGSYRLDAVAILAGVSIGKNFSLGYACDINLGAIKSYQPSHEFMLTYRGNLMKGKKSVPLVSFY